MKSANLFPNVSKIPNERKCNPHFFKKMLLILEDKHCPVYQSVLVAKYRKDDQTDSDNKRCFFFFPFYSSNYIEVGPNSPEIRVSFP